MRELGVVRLAEGSYEIEILPLKPEEYAKHGLVGDSTFDPYEELFPEGKPKFR